MVLLVVGGSVAGRRVVVAGVKVLSACVFELKVLIYMRVWQNAAKSHDGHTG